MKISIIEDHDYALKVWRGRAVKGLDLVHLDAHIDFSFHPARPVEKVIKDAKSVKELKEKLEYAISFLHYEKDFNKQTDIGNYIYPAMEEGIVRNFYWVVPGRKNEFNKSGKAVRNIFKQIMRDEGNKGNILEDANGIISAKCLGRDFIACSLDNLPILTKNTLLDIDTDFLVTGSVLNAENTKNIGKRKPWILPKDLAETLKEKIQSPQITTIAYSVNGGWTPMEYRHLADELAYHLSPSGFKGRFEKNAKAAGYFKLFNATGKRRYYWQAVELNPAYRMTDNNYGPLYLSLGKLSSAKNEFEKILRADRENAACLFGLGSVALERKEFKEARRSFYSALGSVNNGGLFKPVKDKIIFALAKSEFALKNFKQAKEFLLLYRRSCPLEPESCYFLGIIFEKEKKFSRAAKFYKDAIRLGFDDIGPLWRLIKISGYLKGRDDIIKYVIFRYKIFKRNFTGFKKSGLKKGKKSKGLYRIEMKILALEKRINTRR